MITCWHESMDSNNTCYVVEECPSYICKTSKTYFRMTKNCDFRAILKWPSWIYRFCLWITMMMCWHESMGENKCMVRTLSDCLMCLIDWYMSKLMIFMINQKVTILDFHFWTFSKKLQGLYLPNLVLLSERKVPTWSKQKLHAVPGAPMLASLGIWSLTFWASHS